MFALLCLLCFVDQPTTTTALVKLLMQYIHRSTVTSCLLLLVLCSSCRAGACPHLPRPTLTCCFFFLLFSFLLVFLAMPEHGRPARLDFLPSGNGPGTGLSTGQRGNEAAPSVGGGGD